MVVAKDNAEIVAQLKKHYKTENASPGKGGFFVQGQGWISMAAARKVTGLQAEKRVVKPRIQPWGDYATIAMINQPRKAKQPKPLKRSRNIIKTRIGRGIVLSRKPLGKRSR